MAKPRLGMGLRALSGAALANMKVQAYLAAAAINLKRLAATLLMLILRSVLPASPFAPCTPHPRAGLEARAITWLIAA